MNPFSQGWSNALLSNNAPGGTPSFYGVVPSYPLANGQPPAGSNLIRFTFVPSGSDSSILNSLVTGSSGQTYFRITTNSTAHGYSVVQNSRYQNIAYIEWRSQPVVEIYNIVSKRNSAAWLVLSSNRSYRKMNAQGQSFRWVPDERNINLYSADPSNPQFFGGISQAQDGGTTLNLTDEALQLGMLEISVVSALLFLCGRRID
ncbi:hypothetical protein GGX14DRAFT_653141 [Mycena pura]|uniref:DUF6593 domain-containing protein n=1 Tax=Mycena pura TaxID=153505 RepID=A0AAD6V8R8_9AGAR|nr:hypothetical protein GGX14DRAFT_653141 [Mycena pura]